MHAAGRAETAFLGPCTLQEAFDARFLSHAERTKQQSRPVGEGRLCALCVYCCQLYCIITFTAVLPMRMMAMSPLRRFVGMVATLPTTFPEPIIAPVME